MDFPQLKRTDYPDRPDRTHTDQAHFRDFRDYHLPLVRLHHAYLTQGIARGLEVRGTLGGTTITVEPGVAVDPQGQLLVLTSTETRSTLTLLNRTLYVTLQFAEGRGLDGRLEQVPAEQVRLRDAPTLDGGSDEAVVVLALVKTDGTGRVTALQVQDGERRFRRQLLGEQVEALELRRSVLVGDRVVAVPAGTIAAGEQGGLRLTVPGADDEILVAREDGEAFRRVEIRADVQVSGTIEGTLAAGAVGPDQVAAGAITSVRLAEADGTSGQETNRGSGVKTGHLQDQAVTGPKIADATIQMTNLHPEVQRAIEDRGIGDDAILSAMIAEADGTSGQETGRGQGVKTGHLQDQAVTAAKLQAHPSDSSQRAVGPTHLQEQAVRTAHLQNQAVTGPKIADATIQMTNLHPEVQRAIEDRGIGDDAILSAMIAEADGTSGQETGRGQGVKTGHLQDQAVTAAKLQAHPSDSSQRAVGPTHLQEQAVRTAHLQNQAVTGPKIADATIQMTNLHPEVQRAIEDRGIGDDAILSAMIAEADGTSGQETGRGQGVKTGHLQDQAVTAAKLQAHPSDSTQRAVGPNHLQQNAVTNEKVEDNTLFYTKLRRDGDLFSAENRLSVENWFWSVPLGSAGFYLISVTLVNPPRFNALGVTWDFETREQAGQIIQFVNVRYKASAGSSDITVRVRAYRFAEP